MGSPVAAVVIAREESKAEILAARARGGEAATSSAAAASCAKEFLPAQVSERRYARKRREITIEHRGYRVAPVRPRDRAWMIGAKAGVRDDRRETAGVVAVGGRIRVVHQPRAARGDERRVSGWQHCRRGRWRERCDLGRRQVRKLPRQRGRPVDDETGRAARVRCGARVPQRCAPNRRASGVSALAAADSNDCSAVAERDRTRLSSHASDRRPHGAIRVNAPCQTDRHRDRHAFTRRRRSRSMP